MIEVVDNKTMRYYDAKTIENGVPSKELMLRAANGIISCMGELSGKKIAILCGPGNNGGDGYAVAYLLSSNSDIDISVYCLSDKYSEDSLYYHNKCLESGIKIITDPLTKGSLENYDIILDCIFGTGFHGEIQSPYKECIEEINRSKAYTVSADISSGLNGNNGLGDNAVISDMVVAIGSHKLGYYLNNGKDYCRKISSCDIGIKIESDINYLITAKDIADLFKVRKCSSNKGTYGYIGLLGGSIQYCGAAKLSNIAANLIDASIAGYRAGAGVVKLIVPDAISDAIRQQILESTCIEIPSDSEGYMTFNDVELSNALSNIKALGLGMGWGNGKEYPQILDYILKNYTFPIVIDADGLNMLSKLDIKAYISESSKVVLTPHLKEFSRLCKKSIEEIKNDSVNIAKEYAKSAGVILLLKGPTTIITDGYDVYLCNRGCAGMATAGSGDVLTGILTALLGYNEFSLKTVAAASYVNGLAGELAQDKYGDISMMAGDTLNCIADAIKEIRSYE